MAVTTRLSITKLTEGQQQKEVTINTALDTIDGVAYKHMGSYTIANLPAAADNTDAFAVATDASGGPTLVMSDGTNWKIIAVIGATVS